MKELSIIGALLGFTAITPASAYTYSFANTLDVPVMISVGGLAAGNMFGGHEPKKAQRADYGNRYIVYKHAQKLQGPQTIPPKTTIDFQFRNTKIGVCINIQSFQMAVGDGQMLPTEVQRAPRGGYISGILQNIDSIGNTMGQVGSAVGGASPSPQAAAVGAGLNAVGGLLPVFADLAMKSACKSAKFIIGKDQEGKYVLQSDSFS